MSAWFSSGARWLTGLSSSQRLALVAIVLGAGALALGGPADDGRITIDERELAAMVEGEVDHVTPGELADWIVLGRQDYRLIDLRSEAEFAQYAIPTAERLAITQLADADLPRNEKIVLYSAEGIHSAQAWFLLKAKRYPAAYILLGGLSQWTEQVLYPVEPAASAGAAERIEFAKAAERARYFGGESRSAQPALSTSTVPSAPPATRVLPKPVPAPSGAGSAPAKKKKEGC